LQIAIHEDRTAEFLLVRSVRESVQSISRNISESTRVDYLSKYRRMLRNGYLPEQAGTKRSFYAYRAALLFGASLDAQKLLRTRDKAEYKSEAWAAAVSELKRIATLFERYPPDPQRKHYATGSTSFTWAAVRKEFSTNLRRQGLSKKKVLSQLRKEQGWRERLIENVTEKHRDSIAVIALTGARPSELARGVSIEIVKNERDEIFLSFRIMGSKVVANAGQLERTIYVRADGAIAKILLSKISAEGVSSYIVKTHPANLTAAVIKAGRRLFPNLTSTITPYVLRHAIASDIKRQPQKYSRVQLAEILGHQTTETQQYYGYAVSSTSCASIEAVKASSLVRNRYREPPLGKISGTLSSPSFRLQI
jgi:integrase